ncbi:MAG: hypothetical protein HN742_35855 [Lentisphaerae bacterium]|jgi:hypothetical protein|nr:hypothetical protein [Lentisphaerota bacterium]MBT4818197.1 hypothetical protein [Lentisphaerota bacterium]MBT5612408.1 hypothetical protein [Lentisphaerota bacterium]MBT7062082.1 hypothetical protein [Lentisphaerota bacterium]MBT7847300.1 hypothetical protein [Lentisphaerota bacterium]
MPDVLSASAIQNPVAKGALSIAAPTGGVLSPACMNANTSPALSISNSFSAPVMQAPAAGKQQDSAIELGPDHELIVRGTVASAHYLRYGGSKLGVMQ